MERSRTRSSRPENELDSELHSAVYNNDEKEVQNLIKRGGVDVNSRDSSGKTPLYKASWRGNEEIVMLLLNAGANPNVRDDTGKTPLMKACFQRYPKIVKILLDADVDVNVEDENYTTPLTYVLLLTVDRNEYAPEIVTMLIEAGAKVKSSDVDYAYGVSDETYRIVRNAYLRQQLTPLLSASARGQIFDPRLYDRRTWRIIGKYVN